MIRYTITSYCSECGIDFFETDAEDLDELVEIEHRADQMFLHHNKKGECG